jgi:hypothetical protein
VSSEPSPICDVLGLVVEERDNPGRVLLGVRRSVPTSTRHPEVLSTPTMRVPAGVMDLALATIPELAESSLAPAEFEVVEDAAAVRIGEAMSMAEPLGYLVEALLARKLGVADDLLEGALSGFASPIVLARDTVLDPASEDGEPEETRMLSLRVSLDRGSVPFPASTAAYSSLHWVEADLLPEAVAGNRPLDLIPEIDLNVCLHGLCVRSAAAYYAQCGAIHA